MDKKTLAIGDTVRIKPYKVQTLYGDYVEACASGKTAIILKLGKDYDWRSQDNQAVLRIIEGENQSAHIDTQAIEHLELVAKGTGRVELGATHPWTVEELQEQRWTTFCQRAAAVNLQHEGFRNPATFLAWLYLNQEPRARRELAQRVRKDGTVNPVWPSKLFEDLRLKVDEWAFECPLDIPEEFVARNNPVAQLQRVDWQEVTAMFEPETETV